MVASGNFRENRPKNPFFHTSAPLLLPAIEEETLEKGEPLGLSRPWRLDSAPFRPCQGGLEGGATWRAPRLPGKMAARFRWDLEPGPPRSPHLRVLSRFPGPKAGPARGTGNPRPRRPRPRRAGSARLPWRTLPESGALPYASSGRPGSRAVRSL